MRAKRALKKSPMTPKRDLLTDAYLIHQYYKPKWFDVSTATEALNLGAIRDAFIAGAACERGETEEE